MRRVLAAAALLAFATAAFACGDSKPKQTTLGGPAPAARGAAAAVAAGAASNDGGPVLKEDISENDFVENDRNRDPFRSYVQVEKKEKLEDQRHRVLGQYSVDELTLSAIVLGDTPRAMFVDPKKKGWVITRGQFIGRTETVHTGGQNGADYTVVWRVDRIRPQDVVLVREDPANSSAPPATKVIPLHPGGAGEQEDGQL